MTITSSVQGRERRSTAGTRMSSLVGQAAKDDDEFWNHSTWAEDEDGSFHESDEESEVRKDTFDSDFDDSEDDGEADNDGSNGGRVAIEEMEILKEERKEKRAKRKKKMMDVVSAGREMLQKRKNAAQRKKALRGDGMNAGLVLNVPGASAGLTAIAPVSAVRVTPRVGATKRKLPAAKTGSPERKSTRIRTTKFDVSNLLGNRSAKRSLRVSTINNSIQTTVEQQQQAIVSSSSTVTTSNRGGKRGKRKFTQDELILEAVQTTEQDNERWLLSRKRSQVEENTRRELSEKLRRGENEIGRKTICKYNSKRGCYNTLTFPSMDHVPEIFTRHQINEKERTLQIERIRKDNICVITGKKAKYRDPKTGKGYHDLAAFRELRRRYNAGEKLEFCPALPDEDKTSLKLIDGDKSKIAVKESSSCSDGKTSCLKKSHDDESSHSNKATLPTRQQLSIANSTKTKKTSSSAKDNRESRNKITPKQEKSISSGKSVISNGLKSSLSGEGKIFRAQIIGKNSAIIQLSSIPTANHVSTSISKSRLKSPDPVKPLTSSLDKSKGLDVKNKQIPSNEKDLSSQTPTTPIKCNVSTTVERSLVVKSIGLTQPTPSSKNESKSTNVGNNKAKINSSQEQIPNNATKDPSLEPINSTISVTAKTINPKEHEMIRHAEKPHGDGDVDKRKGTTLPSNKTDSLPTEMIKKEDPPEEKNNNQKNSLNPVNGKPLTADKSNSKNEAGKQETQKHLNSASSNHGSNTHFMNARNTMNYNGHIAMATNHLPGQTLMSHSLNQSLQQNIHPMHHQYSNGAYTQPFPLDPSNPTIYNNALNQIAQLGGQHQFYPPSAFDIASLYAMNLGQSVLSNGTAGQPLQNQPAMFYKNSLPTMMNNVPMHPTSANANGIFPTSSMYPGTATSNQEKKKEDSEENTKIQKS